MSVPGLTLKLLHISTIILLTAIENSLELDIHEFISKSAAHSEFCYPNSECWNHGDKDQKIWPGTCSHGSWQSPVDVPRPVKVPAKNGTLKFDKNAYKSDGFVIQNNGHTIVLKITKNATRRSSMTLGLTIGSEAENNTAYVFHRAHFHWGENNSVGSEHTIQKQRYALELHMVHYRGIYPGVEEAIAAEGDENALAVVGILFEASDKNADHPQFANIIKSIPVNLTDGNKIDLPIDLNAFITSENLLPYLNFRGSLTTPPCSEIVNWIVFTTPIKISSKDVMPFRGIKDTLGFPLTRNYRDIQFGNMRPFRYFKFIEN